MRTGSFTINFHIQKPLEHEHTKSILFHTRSGLDADGKFGF